MSKEDVISTLLYLLMATAIVLVGFLWINPAFQSTGELGFLKNGATFAFILVGLVVGILINVLLFVFGYVLGALMGGYRIVSTNVLGFNFYKVEDENGKLKTKFRFKSFSGLTGETLIDPKSEKSNPMFYVFMPLIFLLIEVAALVFLMTYTPKGASHGFYLIKYGLVIAATIGLCMGLYNYFPAKLDSANDGYRLVLLSKKINIQAFNSQLRVKTNNFFNKPNEEMEVFEEITDFTAQVNCHTAMLKYKNGQVDEALEIIEKCLESKEPSKSTRRALLLNKIYIYYLKKTITEATAMVKALSEDDGIFVTNCKSLPAIRVYILYIGIVEKSRSEVEFALDRKRKFKDKVSEGERIFEEGLIEEALNYVKEVNPGLFKEEKPTA